MIDRNDKLPVAGQCQILELARSTAYNRIRPHSSLGDKTPDEFYFDNLPALPKAA